MHPFLPTTVIFITVTIHYRGGGGNIPPWRLQEGNWIVVDPSTGNIHLRRMFAHVASLRVAWLRPVCGGAPNCCQLTIAKYLKLIYSYCDEVRDGKIRGLKPHHACLLSRILKIIYEREKQTLLFTVGNAAALTERKTGTVQLQYCLSAV